MYEVAAFSFTATRKLASPINPTYLNLLRDRRNKVNSDLVTIDFDDVYFQFPIGSLRIVDGHGGRTGRRRHRRLGQLGANGR